ncbi:MAG TPA: thioredoxin domain-containing protein [Gemmatimonadaceae bacterium]|nr:thioredoxin domain-containing protein [Gemmatimonadaceae bacterium]
MNRLARETSPYLLQHAHNPVDWYPWGAEALERARREDKPILLSIGYAACHWCHVMERESFEDEGTARVMNEHFVNIKVDREERPDLDGIYMSAVQAMTGHGGWPMTMFLTPEGVPFFGGTYFPPDDRMGMPSFRRVLAGVADAYQSRREEVMRSGEELKSIYVAATTAPRSTGALGPTLLERAWRSIAQRYDARRGGFEGAPKFPQAMALDFSLRYWRRTGTSHALEITAHSFQRMARGGIYDQVGGGFHRYAVDAVWLVPHFEKMLYDNALLSRLGVHLWQATGDAETRRVTEETIDWAIREMLSPEGGFYSSLDADSEGEEGKFYVWSVAELEEVLGEDGGLASRFWGASAGGNFEGHNILHVPNEPSAVAAREGVELSQLADVIDRARQTLSARRAQRVWPGRDEKVLASWNGLMLRALADGARVFGRGDWRDLALRSGHFLAREMVRDNKVFRSWKEGQARITGFLEDHAAVALAFLSLYELTLDASWLTRARLLGDSMVTSFWDESTNVFFDTAHDHERLITRPREVTDNATPAGTSLAVELLLRLAELFRDADLQRRATWVLETLAAPLAQHGAAFGYLLGAADLAIHGATEVAIVGDPTGEDFRALTAEVARQYLPALVLAGGPPEDGAGIALLEGRVAREGRATGYVCRQYLCSEPTSDPGRLRSLLDEAATERQR